MKTLILIAMPFILVGCTSSTPDYGDLPSHYEQAYESARIYNPCDEDSYRDGEWTNTQESVIRGFEDGLRDNGWQDIVTENTHYSSWTTTAYCPLGTR